MHAYIFSCFLTTKRDETKSGHVYMHIVNDRYPSDLGIGYWKDPIDAIPGHTFFFFFSLTFSSEKHKPVLVPALGAT